MWLLKNLLWLVVMIVVVGFCILNLNETVSAVRLPGHVYTLLSLNVVLFVSFVLGMVTAFGLSIVHYIRTRAAMARLRRELDDLKRELGLLRNLPLEDFRSPGGARSAD